MATRCCCPPDKREGYSSRFSESPTQPRSSSAFSVASNSHGTVAVAIQVCISYFKAVSSGTLYAKAKEVTRNPKLASYLIEVTDDTGSLLALFQGTVYRKSARINEVVD